MTYILKERPQAHFPNAQAQYGERTPEYPDFNFNIRLGGTAMAGLVAEYQDVLQDMIPDVLLPPADEQALHMTIVRVGSEQKEAMTRHDFLELIHKIAPTLGKIVVPRFMLGKNCYLGRDGFVFDVDPRGPFDQIHQVICEELGKKFSPPELRHATGFYTAGEVDNEVLEELNRRLIDHPDAVEIDVTHVAALEQYVVETPETMYYDGEVIENIALANAK